jgi:hypothetical protein
MTTTLPPTYSPAQYNAALAAVTKLLQSDVNSLVPGWAQGMIPSGTVEMLAPALTTAALEAAFGVGSTPDVQAPSPPVGEP